MARLDSRLLVLFLLACGQPEALQPNIEDFWREKDEIFWLFGGTKTGGE